MSGAMRRNVLLGVPTSGTDTANLVLNYNGNKRYLEAVQESLQQAGTKVGTLSTK